MDSTPETDRSVELSRFTELITAPEQPAAEEAPSESPTGGSLTGEIDSLEALSAELVEAWNGLHNAFDTAGLLGTIRGPSDNSKAPQVDGMAPSIKRLADVADVLRDLLNAMNKDNARLQL